MVTKTGSTIVGALACQKNSYLQNLRTKVLSCDPHQGHVTPKDKQNKNLKKKKDEPEPEKEDRFAIELEDTVIFPEGGGQPSDQGYIESKATMQRVFVDEVIRDKLTALHLTKEAIEPGTEVSLTVDWPRRFDHMQQHTGQHLVSAILDQYELFTLSWGMGEVMNYVELPKRVSEKLLNEVAEKCNQVILDDLPITFEYPSQDGGVMDDVSHLPSDYDLSKGLLRVVKIGNLDRNPCCGTHLKSTSQIQSISFCHQLSVRGGNSRLYFVCGSRVFRYALKNYDILKKSAGNTLSCQVDEVFDKVKALNENYREALAAKNNLLKELMAIEAKRVFESFKNTKSELEFVYRKDPSPESLTFFQKELLTLGNAEKNSDVDFDKKHTVVMVIGSVNDPGMIKIMGPLSPDLQIKVKEILPSVKGGGKGNNFQGKVTKYEKGEVESLVNYFQDLELVI